MNAIIAVVSSSDFHPCNIFAIIIFGWSCVNMNICWFGFDFGGIKRNIFAVYI